ncbi:MAG: hypothetical protein AB1629_06630 [Candidatus Omnitrophota bacterium]
MLRFWLIFILIFSSFSLVYCQDDLNTRTNNQIDLEEELGPITDNGISQEAEINLQWVWGEVTEVNLENSKIKIRYLDYETDAEREETFILDKDSEFENVSSAQEIKVSDSAGIDYYIDKEGKRIIKSISIEKLSIPEKQ